MRLKIRNEFGEWVDIPAIKGEPGPQGPAGANGSDANVTKENITAALNYEPVDPKDVYKKDETYNKEEIAQLIGSSGGAGGGSLLQIQADYEQNNRSSVSYIKNRPFYEEIGKEFFSWDGQPTEFQTKLDGRVVYKICDFELANEILGGEYTYVYSDDQEYKFTIEEKDIVFLFNNNNEQTQSYLVVINGEIQFYSFEAPGEYNFYGLKFNAPLSGIWFNENENLINTTLKKDSIKKLDSKFLEDIRGNWQQENKESIDFIKNKPFYEIKKNSYYSQIENPEPYSFEVPEAGITFYKISDLELTKEQVFNNTSILFGGNTIDEPIDIVTENLYIQFEKFNSFSITNNIFSLFFFNDIGEFPLEVQGYIFNLNIEEKGIYYGKAVGEGIPEGRTIEINYTEIKQIDKKFLPGETFGYEIEATEIFKQEENPFLVYFEDEKLGFSAYKISNVMYTLKQLQEQGITFIINGVEENSLDWIVEQFANGNGIGCETGNGEYKFSFLNAGHFLINEKNDLYMDVPETGMYLMMYYKEKIPEGFSIEFKYNDTKKIEDKFIKNMDWKKVKNKPFGEKEVITEEFVIEKGKELDIIHLGISHIALKISELTLSKEQLLNNFIFEWGIKPSENQEGRLLGKLDNWSNVYIEERENGYVFFHSSIDSEMGFGMMTNPGILHFDFFLTENAPVPIPSATVFTEDQCGFYVLFPLFHDFESDEGLYFKITYEKVSTLNSQFLPYKKINFDQTNSNEEDFIDNRPLGLIKQTKETIKILSKEEFENLTEEEQEKYLFSLSFLKIGNFIPEKNKVNEFIVSINVTRNHVEYDEEGNIELIEPIEFIPFTFKVSDEQFLLSLINNKVKSPIFSFMKSAPEIEAGLVDSLGSLMLYFSLFFRISYEEFEIYDEEDEVIMVCEPGFYLYNIGSSLFGPNNINRETEFNIQVTHNIYQKLDDKYVRGRIKDFVFTILPEENPEENPEEETNTPFEAGQQLFFDCDKRELMNVVSSLLVSGGYSCNYRIFLSPYNNHKINTNMSLNSMVDVYFNLIPIGNGYFRWDNYPDIDIFYFDINNLKLFHVETRDMFGNGQQASSTFNLRKKSVVEKMQGLAEEQRFNLAQQLNSEENKQEVAEKIKDFIESHKTKIEKKENIFIVEEK